MKIQDLLLPYPDIYNKIKAENTQNHCVFSTTFVYINDIAEIAMNNSLIDCTTLFIKKHNYTQEVVVTPKNDLDKLWALIAETKIRLNFIFTTKEEILQICNRFYGAYSLSFIINNFNQNQTLNSNKIKQKDVQACANSLQKRDRYIWRTYSYEENTHRVLIHENLSLVPPEKLHKYITQGTFYNEVTEPQVIEAPREILQYSTKVENILPVRTSSKTRFGIELELENATAQNIKTIHSFLKTHAIMKRDGSLQNGVEIVTVPASIEEHKLAFKPFFDSNHTLQAKSNCGIHIHVSRNNMSFLALGRMMKFLTKNKSHIIKIAGRNSQSYAEICSNWDLTSPWNAVNESTKYQKLPKFTWTKYTGINICPNQTAEFRLFKSTTKWDEFCRFLEFTESFVNYCTLAGNDNKGKIKSIDDMLTFNNYKDFVLSRASAHPFLAKFLRESI